jgi:hypothetical protein
MSPSGFEPVVYWDHSPSYAARSAAYTVLPAVGTAAVDRAFARSSFAASCVPRHPGTPGGARRDTVGGHPERGGKAMEGMTVAWRHTMKSGIPEEAESCQFVSNR